MVSLWYGGISWKRLIEFRYYQSLNDFVNNPVVNNRINQVHLILVY